MFVAIRKLTSRRVDGPHALRAFGLEVDDTLDLVPGSQVPGGVEVGHRIRHGAPGESVADTKACEEELCDHFDSNL